MKLMNFLEGLNGVRFSGNLDEEISDIAYDSRRVGKGSLFVALEGYRHDGHAFIDEALERGAVAVLAQKAVSSSRFKLNADPLVSIIITPEPRKAMAFMSRSFFQHPSKKLDLVGVTGTNGKTTTCYLIESILKEAGRKPGVIGTISYRYGGEETRAGQTTPESPDLQRLLSSMAENGMDSCVMEVSSHSLELDRVLGCRFRTAVFTNLTRDHLDFHRTMENYFRSKMKLFTDYPLDAAVINVDDPAGREIARLTRADVISYGLKGKAHIYPLWMEGGLDGASMLVSTPIGDVEISAGLLGETNAYNILAAVGAAVAQGVSLKAISSGISRVRSVPGRFETISEGQEFSVVIDYAHTPDALERVLSTARKLVQRRLITVFGCGGDRDRGKRSLMGAVATEQSDYVIITSDNPRSEDPLSIIRDIELGIAGFNANSKKVASVPDRRAAIEKAVAMASAGDMVIIAGKGHEDYQIIGNRRIHFSDREVALQCIRSRLGIGDKPSAILNQAS